MKTLAERLSAWGKTRDWVLELGVHQMDGANFGQVLAKMGPTTGYGRTTNEAINNLADGMVEEGWADDRPTAQIDAQCSACKSDGKGTYLTDFRCQNCGLEGEMVHSLAHEKNDGSREECPRCEARRVWPGAFIA